MHPTPPSGPAERALERGADATPVAAVGTETRTMLPDVLLHLWAVQFQQLSWLGAAGAGGVLALVQAGFFTERVGATVSMASFALASLVSVLGPLLLSDGVATGRDIRRSVHGYILAAIVLVGMGIGGLVMGGVIQVVRAPTGVTRSVR